MPHIQTDHLSGMQQPYSASPLQSPSTGMSDEIMYPSPSYMQQSFPHHSHYPSLGGNNATGGSGSPHTSGTTSVINSPLTPSSASVPSFVGIQVSPTAASRMSGGGNMKMDLDMVEPHLGRPGSGGGGGGGGGESGSGSGSATIPSESVWMHHLGQFHHHPPTTEHHHHGVGDERGGNGNELTGQIEMILEGHGGSVFVPVKQNGNRGRGGGHSRQDHPFHGHHGQSTHNETYDLPMC